MVAAVSSTTTTPNSKVLSSSTANPKRAPLSPSRNDNNSPPLPRQPKPIHVPSRSAETHTTTSSSCSSSTRASSSNSVSTPKSTKILTKMFSRSLSVSFQGESFSLPVSIATKPTTNRNDTSELKKPPAALDRTSDYSRQKLAGRSPRLGKMKMSVDFTNDRKKFTESRIASAVRALRKSMITDPDDSSDVSLDNVKGGGPRAIVVPARFWQETINQVQRVQPDLPVVPQLLKNNKVVSRKVLHDIPKVSPSDKKVTPSSASLMVNGVGSNSNLGNSPSILSFSFDSNRGKVGEEKLVDVHELRLLHNKHLQWRFANARVDATMKVQRATAQKRLYNAWVTITKFWHSVISKRVEMHQLKLNLKLHSILKKQMSYLDTWDLTNEDHSISLVGAIAALESSSLCLPVLHGAKADVKNFIDAICSAYDVMQAVAVLLCSLMTKVENVTSLSSELASAMKMECSLLDQCKDMFSTLTLLEMQDCSMRTHTLQLVPPSTMTQW